MRNAVLAASLLLLAGITSAQTLVASAALAPDPELAQVLPARHWDSGLALAPPAAPPRMTPELAFSMFQQRLHQQGERGPLSYSALTIISAELPESNQRGKFELLRELTAPNELKFKPIEFTGDGFVKSNVINRWLVSEVQRAQRGADPDSALTQQNYKFSYKGEAEIFGHDAHIYQLKPRTKAAGLFKGKIYIDAASGSLLRAEGTLARSPSFFIKKVEFTSDFADIGGNWLPVELHSITYTRVIGRAIVDVSTSNYIFNSSTSLIAAR
jgi:hypothetical protein